MSETIQQIQQRFECVGLSVHFIYSFALAKQVSDEEFEPVDACDLADDKDLSPDAAGLGERLKYLGLETGTPDERRGIKQHLSLKEDVAFKRFEPFHALLFQNPGSNADPSGNARCELRIEPMMRILRAGATFCFKVELVHDGDSLIPLGHVHAVLGLVQQLEDEPAPSLLRLEDQPQTVTLHSLFVDRVRQFAKDVKAKKEEIVWLDESSGYLTGLGDGDKNESQSPWVVTIAEVKGETASAFCETWADQQHSEAEKEFRISQFEAEVAGILYRSVHGLDFTLEPGYVDRRITGGAVALHNLNLDARLHVSVSNRSVLCIHPYISPDSPPNGSRPESYFLPDLLDLCGILRARWHMLTVMNKYLDDVLTVLRKEDRTAEDKMEMVLSSRSWLARLLEDPELCRVAGDVLADISLCLKHVFREEPLRKLLVEKVELIERIREGLGELGWLSMRKQFRQQVRT